MKKYSLWATENKLEDEFGKMEFHRIAICTSKVDIQKLQKKLGGKITVRNFK